MTPTTPGPATIPAVPDALTELRRFVETQIESAGLQTALRCEIRPRGEARDPARSVPVEETGSHALILTRDQNEQAVSNNVAGALARAWLQAFSTARREAPLLEELAINWESLQALYDLSADLQTDLTPDEVLHRIVERAAKSVAHGSALLLLEKQGGLEAAAWFNCPQPGIFSQHTGLVGRVLRDQSELVLNGRVRIASQTGIEGVWRNASIIALAGISMPQRGLFGVMALWSEDPRSNFNANLVRLLEAMGQQAALVVESERLRRTLRERELLEQELTIGSMIQKTLLFGESSRQGVDFDVNALTLPSQLVDGDFLDVYERDDGILEIQVGDVMGKGIPAALLGAATKAHLLRAEVETGDLNLTTADGQSRLEATVNRLGRTLTPHLLALDRFVTLCYAMIDPRHKVIRWVYCGHTSLIHYRAIDGTVACLKGDGLPLGVLTDEQYRESSCDLERGDVLLFYSDGVTESQNLVGDLFGEQRLMELVGRHGHEITAVLIEALRREVAQLSRRAPAAGRRSTNTEPHDRAAKHTQRTAAVLCLVEGTVRRRGTLVRRGDRDAASVGANRSGHQHHSPRLRQCGRAVAHAAGFSAPPLFDFRLRRRWQTVGSGRCSPTCL